MTSFLALTGFAGGIGLIADLNAPPLEMLEGSPFRKYIVPGLALFVIVGGTASVGAYLLIKRHPRSALGSLLSGLVIIVAFSIAFRVVKPAAPRPTQATPA